LKLFIDSRKPKRNFYNFVKETFELKTGKKKLIKK